MAFPGTQALALVCPLTLHWPVGHFLQGDLAQTCQRSPPVTGAPAALQRGGLLKGGSKSFRLKDLRPKSWLLSLASAQAPSDRVGVGGSWRGDLLHRVTPCPSPSCFSFYSCHAMQIEAEPVQLSQAQSSGLEESRPFCIALCCC